MVRFFYNIISSRFGQLGIVWKFRNKRPWVVRVVLPKPRVSVGSAIKRIYPGAKCGQCREINRIQGRIKQFLNGAHIEMSLRNCDLTGLYHFQKRVLLLERQIPRGSVSTYRILAQKLGKPNHARAVGQALAKNHFPVIIPCHRVIKSDGSLGGYAGGVRMKKKLLETEGIKFDRHGKAIAKKLW